MEYIMNNPEDRWGYARVHEVPLKNKYLAYMSW